MGWGRTRDLLAERGPASIGFYTTGHRTTARVSLDWEVLAQCAQAAEDAELAALAADCHPQTLRQLRWSNAQLKELAAQAITAT